LPAEVHATRLYGTGLVPPKSLSLHSDRRKPRSRGNRDAYNVECLLDLIVCASQASPMCRVRSRWHVWTLQEKTRKREKDFQPQSWQRTGVGVHLIRSRPSELPDFLHRHSLGRQRCPSVSPRSRTRSVQRFRATTWRSSTRATGAARTTRSSSSAPSLRARRR
jgi:hypothetical protein